MSVHKGYIKFKSQKEINEARRKKTAQDYKQLKARVESIVNENSKIISNRKAH